jgi:hypothetical protein
LLLHFFMLQLSWLSCNDRQGKAARHFSLVFLKQHPSPRPLPTNMFAISLLQHFHRSLLLKVFFFTTTTRKRSSIHHVNWKQSLLIMILREKVLRDINLSHARSYALDTIYTTYWIHKKPVRNENYEEHSEIKSEKCHLVENFY